MRRATQKNSNLVVTNGNVKSKLALLKPPTAEQPRRSKPATPLPKNIIPDEMQVIKAPPKIFKKSQSNSPTISRSQDSSIDSDQGESVKSTTRHMSSQTGDINDDLFLKDVIIR